MFTVEAGPTRFCSGFSRREFLGLGSLGAFGLSLPELLRAREAQAKGRGTSQTLSKSFGRAKRCILLYMWGGPPHQDTFDLKPDAPLEQRGEFRPIPTNVPGIEISDHLPLLANQADKYLIVRSMTHNEPDHIAQAHDVLTGNHYVKTSTLITARRTDHPHYGAVLAKLRPQDNGLPSYVQLPCHLRSNSGKVIPGQNGGFLGQKFDPFIVDAVPNKSSSQDPEFRGFSPSNIRLPSDLTLGRLSERKRLVDVIDRGVRDVEKSGQLEEFDGIYQRAYSLVSSAKARKAFDLSTVDPAMRDRYGRHTFGQGVLVARRLAEAGVPLVTVYWRNGPPRSDIGWDNHINNFPDLKKWQLPPNDRAVSALLCDLDESGLLDETLVLWMGEFGRTPSINKRGGRDHWPQAYSVLLAGGGFKRGEVYGSTDARAAHVADNPVSPVDLGATIYHLLGIDVNTKLYDVLNRPHVVCPGTPVSGLLS